MTTKLSEAPDTAPLFLPHELSADGTPSIEAIRRACPMENDERTEEELKSVARFFRLFDRSFSAHFALKREEAVQAKIKRRLSNHKKYLRRKAKLKEGAK